MRQKRKKKISWNHLPPNKTNPTYKTPMSGKKTKTKTAYQKRFEVAVDRKTGHHLEINDYPTLWLSTGLPDGNGEICACGKKHLKYVFKVQNIKNGNTLNVGSTCVKHFGLKTLTDDAQSHWKISKIIEAMGQVSPC